MNQQNIDFCYNIIYNVAPDVKYITQPIVRGHNCRVFIAENITGDKTVFRFNMRPTAHRNYDISRVLQANNIHAPRVALHLYQGQYFETYPYLAGPTLQEKLTQDARWVQKHQHDIFTAIATSMRNIACIPVRDFANIENKNCCDVAQSNILNKTHNRFLGHVVKYGTMALNSGKQNICHCDLTPQNIIINNDCRVAAILDLNAISVANVNFSAAITALALEKYNLNTDDFFVVCRDIMPDKMNYQHFLIAKKILKYYFQQYIKQKNK